MTIPGAGHLSSLEQPDLFNAALSRFLDAHGITAKMRRDCAAVLTVMALVVAWPSARREGTRCRARRATTWSSTPTCATAWCITGRFEPIERNSTDSSAPSRGESIDGASRNEQIAFWLNAYNAFVLRTVIDQYPIVAAVT